MTDPVYHGYDSDSLYAQYNNRARTDAAILAAIKEDQADRSAAFRAGARRLHADLSYGPHERERVDICLPERDGAPLLAFIHGGYWQWNDKEEFLFLAEPFLGAGAAFANIEYALCPAVSLAELVDQVRRAIAFLWRAADDYGYDRNRIAVAGHSAGGHLTAMMLATDWPAFGDGLPPNLVAGGLPVSGVYDLEPIRLTPLNDAVGLDAESARALSPVFMRPLTGAPAIIVYGGAESEEFARQAQDLSGAWMAGAETQVLALPERDHFTALSALAEPDSALFAAASGLLDLPR